MVLSKSMKIILTQHEKHDYWSCDTTIAVNLSQSIS